MNKVFFQLTPDEDGYPTAGAESVWGTDIGDDLYEIENIPFYARGVAMGDIVLAPIGADGVCWFERVVRDCGHGTLRVIVNEAPDVKRVIEQIARHGCTLERMKATFLSVDVPDVETWDRVRAWLAGAEAADELDYEESKSPAAAR